MTESKQNKKLTLGILLTFIICIGSAILATYSTGPYGNYPNPGIHPGMIGPGTFNDSGVANPQWTIPGDLKINEKISASQYCDKDGNNCKNISESGFGGIDPYIVDRYTIDKQIFYDNTIYSGSIFGGTWPKPHITVANYSFIIDRTNPANEDENIQDIKLRATMDLYSPGSIDMLRVYLDGNLIWQPTITSAPTAIYNSNIIDLSSYPEGNHTLIWSIQDSTILKLYDLYVFKNRVIPIYFK